MVFQEWTADYRTQRTYSNPDSSPDSDSDTEAVRNNGGKVAGVAPPGLTINFYMVRSLSR